MPRRNYITTGTTPTYSINDLKSMLVKRMGAIADTSELKRAEFYDQDVWAILAAPQDATLEACKYLGLVPKNSQIQA